MGIEELVAKIQQGDSEAFGRVYDMFAQRIFRYVRLKINNPQEAEDVLQEVFVRAFGSIGTLDPQKMNFSAWLYRVASNTVNDFYRKKYRTPETVDIEAGMQIAGNSSPERDTEVRLNLDTVNKAMLLLPGQYRQVLELRFAQEFSVAETAKILGKTGLAVRLVQHRALKKLESILRNLYE